MTKRTAATMPPKKGKGKAPMTHPDSDYEEPVAEYEDRPRLSIRTRKQPLSKANNVDPIRAPVGAHQMPPDPIYSRLLSSPSITDRESPRKKQRVVVQSAQAGSASGEDPGDSFNKYLEDLVTKEMDKQENALDFSRNSGLEKQARVYGYYLFNSSDQAPKTRERWMKEAMKRVNKMQVADIRANGVGPAVKEALTSAVEGELRGQVTDFTISTKAIINMIKEME